MGVCDVSGLHRFYGKKIPKVASGNNVSGVVCGKQKHCYQLIHVGTRLNQDVEGSFTLSTQRCSTWRLG